MKNNATNSAQHWKQTAKTQGWKEREAQGLTEGELKINNFIFRSWYSLENNSDKDVV